MDIARTPLGTQVTIFAEKPGIVIGKGGKLVHQLTLDLAQNYGVESPQIEVQQVTNPSFNAQIMAERLANALERGWYFRKAGSSIMRRVMDSGALGCEVVIAGKLTGARARTQKFTEGYIKHCGEPSNTIVEKGYAVAIKKLGSSVSRSSSCPQVRNCPTTSDHRTGEEAPGPEGRCRPRW